MDFCCLNFVTKLCFNSISFSVEISTPHHDAALPRWRWSPAGWCRGAGAGWCTVSGWGLSCSSGAGTRTGLVAVPKTN